MPTSLLESQAMRSEFAQVFGEECSDDDGVKVAFKLPDGRNLEHRFPKCTHVQVKGD